MTAENKIDQAYYAMMAAIKAKSDQPNKTDMVESCYWIACKYWELVKTNFDYSIFESEKTEIDFFRNIKPKFTSQIQYFTILAEVLMFVPDEPEKQALFWKEELGKLFRFCERNKQFVEYYESKAVYLDMIYFVKAPADWKQRQPLVFYDADTNFCSTHDHLVRQLLALRMYHDFVRSKLDELKLVE